MESPKARHSARSKGFLTPHLLLAVLATGCGGLASGVATTEPGLFDSELVEVVSASGVHEMRVEVAVTERARRRGLSGRATLPEDAGMLFLFDEAQPSNAGFWMYRTRIPLSIAFLDGDGVILTILRMEPCRSVLSILCRRYRPDSSYVAALEANPDYFSSRAIEPGDRVRRSSHPTPNEEAR